MYKNYSIKFSIITLICILNSILTCTASVIHINKERELSCITITQSLTDIHKIYFSSLVNYSSGELESRLYLKLEVIRSIQTKQQRGGVYYIYIYDIDSVIEDAKQLLQEYESIKVSDSNTYHMRFSVKLSNNKSSSELLIGADTNKNRPFCLDCTYDLLDFTIRMDIKKFNEFIHELEYAKQRIYEIQK